MRCFIIIFFISLLSAFSCTGGREKESNAHPDKSLELYRVADSSRWLDSYSQLKDDFSRAELIQSMGKARQAELLPFLTRQLSLNQPDTLLSSILFAIGQMSDPAAERALGKISFDSLSFSHKIRYLRALSQCGTEKSQPFLIELIEHNFLKAQALEALSICKRREKGKAFFPDDSSAVSAYYTSFYASFKQIPVSLFILDKADALQRKYLFKYLLKMAKKDSARFYAYVDRDSLGQSRLLRSLTTSLTLKNNWRELLYSIPLVSFARDSLLGDRLNQFKKHPNPHIRLVTVRALTNILDNSAAVSLLLNFLEKETAFYMRGKLLFLLAEKDRNMAFRIIMQDLDKGDDGYKALLIDALAVTGLGPAIRTVRQFIQVPNAILANQAFENLTRLRKIRNSEWKAMLNSGDFSSVSLALDYAHLKKKIVPPEKLVSLYRAFNKPAEFEAQKSILRYFDQKTVEQDTSLQKILWKESSHPVVQRLLEKHFGELDWPAADLKNPEDFLPTFLSVDSLPEYSIPPIVVIKTNRGDIQLKLNPQQAPFTVQNFLQLVKSGFYRNLVFHRVVPDFVVQGGDPLGSGWGSTTYLVPSEDSWLPFKRGSLGIATSGFDTGACQFFICQSEQPHLTGNYTCFGEVQSGMGVVDLLLPGDKILDMLLLK